MFDRWLADLMRKGRNVQKHRLYRNVKTLNRVINTFAAAIEALFEARQQGADPFETVFAVVDEEELSRTLATAKDHMRPGNLDYRDLLQRRYALRRKQLMAMFNELSFEAVGKKHPALAALEHVARLQREHGKRVEAVEQTIKSDTFKAPLGHLKHTRWKRHALSGDEINANYYEMAAFQRLKQGLRSGDIAVRGSRRYRDFESYLLDEGEWSHLKTGGDTGLTVSDDPQEYLDARQSQIGELLSALQISLEEGGPVSQAEDGSLQLESLTKMTPAAAKELRGRIYSRVPWVQLSEVVIEVDGWTHFMDSFKHISSGMATNEEQKPALIAALMAAGMNFGFTRMAQATDFSRRQLAWAAEWHFREETMRAARATLDDFVLYHPYSSHWGSGVSSMSDGMRFPVNVQASNAVFNARYFGYRRGITIVTHSADIWMPFETRVINDVREALYVIDALCHNETDFDILEHYTDHAGYTYHVFALCRMLGFRFAPRIRAITEQYLFTVEHIDVQTAIEHLMKGPVDVALITENWDAMQRLAASIRQGRTSAALIMRKLASYPRQNQLALAFNEVGKLERTVFVLEYMLDESLQRRQRLGLNKGESVHALGRALFTTGQGEELSERDVDAQMNRASSLMLLVSAISAWNTIYLDKVMKTLRAEGEEVPEEILPHISPLGWEHINFLGKYDFDFSQSYSLDRLRPLRGGRVSL